MPLIKMHRTFASAQTILMGGRYYNMTDKDLLSRLLKAKDEHGPICDVIKILPKGVTMKQVHNVEPPDPEAANNESTVATVNAIPSEG